MYIHYSFVRRKVLQLSQITDIISAIFVRFLAVLGVWNFQVKLCAVKCVVFKCFFLICVVYSGFVFLCQKVLLIAKPQHKCHHSFMYIVLSMHNTKWFAAAPCTVPSPSMCGLQQPMDSEQIILSQFLSVSKVCRDDFSPWLSTTQQFWNALAIITILAKRMLLSAKTI